MKTNYDAEQFDNTNAVREGWTLTPEGRIRSMKSMDPDSYESASCRNLIEELAYAGSVYHRDALDIEAEALKQESETQ